MDHNIHVWSLAEKKTRGLNWFEEFVSIQYSNSSDIIFQICWKNISKIPPWKTQEFAELIAIHWM